MLRASDSNSCGINKYLSAMSDLTTSTIRESPESAEQLLNNTIYQHVAHIEQFPHIIGFNDPFFVVDIEAIRRQHDLWVSHLPFVRPFYGEMKLSYSCILGN